MIEYATLDDLRRFRSEALSEEHAGVSRRPAPQSPAGSTFLSHSSKDVEFLPGVIALLEGHGAAVYIDKKDDSLPPYTSRQTAKSLRTKIQECRKFVLFATKKSKDSLWMPWELGIADGIKRSTSTAVLPGVETATDTTWSQREYLGVYDRIVWGDLEDGGRTQRVWMVLNQERNTGTELSNWLKTA